MYKSYQVKIIKNDSCIDNGDGELDSDYEYLYDDELQILSESGDILFTLKGYEFKSYDCIDNYLIVDIDEGHKFTFNNIYIDLCDFITHTELFKKGNEYYRRIYNKEKKMIEFKNTLYHIKYFFDNVDTIIDDFEFDRHQFDTTKDTLLMAIFKLFNKNVDNNSQIRISGFTFGMSCQDIGKFKTILRDHNKTIEQQLTDTLFEHINPVIHKIFDINLTIYYKDNNVDNVFAIRLECKDKELIHSTYYGCYYGCYYGYYDENAKLKLVSESQ